MKKYYKEMITIIVVVAILVTLIVFMVRGSNNDGNKLIPDDYYEKYVAEGIIEKKYQNINTVKIFEYSEEIDDTDLTKITYYIPDNMEDGKKYPVVIFVNEDGKTVDTYDGVLKHLASYGFICVGCNDYSAYKGRSTRIIYDHLSIVNAEEDFILENRIDFDNIGLYGHVHGGIGAIRAITEFNVPCNALITTSLPSIDYLVENEFEYLYDVTKVNTSWFLGFTEGTNENKFNSSDYVSDILSKSPSKIISASRINIDYGSSMACFDGYATAYYEYILKSNDEANAFDIEGELSKNILFSNYNRNY